MENSVNIYEKLMRMYMLDCKAAGMSEATLTTYESTLKAFYKFCAEKEHNPLSPASISAYKAYMSVERGNRPTTVSMHLTELKNAFAYGVDMRLIEENPCNPSNMKCEVKTCHAPYKNLLSEDEMAAVVNSTRPKGMHDKNWLRNKAMLVLFLTTGIRNSELRALRICDVDFENGVIEIEKGKGSKYGKVPFSAIAQKAVKAYMESGYMPSDLPETDILFGLNGTSKCPQWHEMDRISLSNQIERTISALTDRKGIRTHALRHSCASLMLDKGLGMETIQTVLRHTSVATTGRYAEHLRPKAPMQSASMVFDALAGAV